MDNNAGTPFYLMRLPQRVLDYVLTLFHVLDLMTLSLVSEQTLALVKTVDTDEFECIDLYIELHHEEMSFEISFDEGSVFVRVTAEDEGGFSVYANYEDGPDVTWPGFDARYYVNHLMNVMNNTPVTTFIVYDEWYDLESLKSTTAGLCLVQIHIADGVSDRTKALTLNQLPIAEAITVGKKDSDEDFHKIAIQNWNLFEVRDGSNFSMNNLNVCNGKDIMVKNSSFTSKDLNRFTKLWMAGTNPNLKRLSVELKAVKTTEEMVAEVLTGIRHRRLANNERNLDFDGFKIFVECGYEFLRSDGSQSIINITPKGNDCVTFTMYIWS